MTAPSVIIASFTVFDVIVVALAFVANCIVLVAAVRCKMSMTGYRRLLVSLSAGNLFICVVHFLSLICDQLLIKEDSAHRQLVQCGANALRILKMIGFLTNLLNICAMSIDHLIGIVWPIKYHQIMDNAIARVSVAAIWAISFSLAFIDAAFWVQDYSTLGKDDEINLVPEINDNSYQQVNNNAEQSIARHSSSSSSSAFMVPFVNSFSNPPDAAVFSNTKIALTLDGILESLQNQYQREEHKKNSCYLLSTSKMLTEVGVVALASISFVTLIVCYGIIFKKISKRHEKPVLTRSLSVKNTNPLKSVLTTLLFLAVFIVCWMPFMINEVLTLLVFPRPSMDSEADDDNAGVGGLDRFFLVGRILSSLLMLYPLVNPIIYAAQIPAIQQHVLLQLSLTFNCPCIIRCLTSHNQRLFLSRMSSSSFMGSTYSIALEKMASVKINRLSLGQAV